MTVEINSNRSNGTFEPRDMARPSANASKKIAFEGSIGKYV